MELRLSSRKPCSMPKSRIQFICQNCGSVHTRWAGKCDACGEWNTLVEEGTSGGIGSGPQATRSARKGRAVVLTSLAGDIEDAPRIASGIGELDRATGGGFVRGSALLVGGDPGIGKSTLLTQAAAALARQGHRIVYVSGEEAPIADAFNRAGKYVLTRGQDPLDWENSHRLASIDAIAALRQGDGPDLIIQGSSTLYPALLEAGLLDRLTTLTYPLVLGSGKRLFGAGTPPRSLRLVRHSVSPKGTIIAHYEPDGAVRTGSFLTIEPSEREKARQQRMKMEG